MLVVSLAESLWYYTIIWRWWRAFSWKNLKTEQQKFSMKLAIAANVGSLQAKLQAHNFHRQRVWIEGLDIMLVHEITTKKKLEINSKSLISMLMSLQFLLDFRRCKKSILSMVRCGRIETTNYMCILWLIGRFELRQK